MSKISYNHTPKISVIIITYNQQDTISRAVDSVLKQKEFIYEVIISDDCSTDYNWEIIKKYKEDFPNFIKIYRNENNLGIFKHIESTWSRPSGDLILSLAGDDAISEELFAKVIKFIREEKIDFLRGSFCIYTDSLIVYPDGSKKLRSNKLISKGFNPISLKIRGLIGSSRGVIKSKELYKQYSRVNIDFGLYTDGLYDIQVQLNSKKNYYISCIGGIYYSGIGIASKTPVNDLVNSKVKLYEWLIQNIKLSKTDRYYILFNMHMQYFSQSPSFKKYIHIWLYFILGTNFNFFNSIRSDLKALAKFFIVLVKAVSSRNIKKP
jgi:glycosyltransferase involved in cell wall biosynthesis